MRREAEQLDAAAVDRRDLRAAERAAQRRAVARHREPLGDDRDLVLAPGDADVEVRRQPEPRGEPPLHGLGRRAAPPQEQPPVEAAGRRGRGGNSQLCRGLGIVGRAEDHIVDLILGLVLADRACRAVVEIAAVRRAARRDEGVAGLGGTRIDVAEGERDRAGDPVDPRLRHWSHPSTAPTGPRIARRTGSSACGRCVSKKQERPAASRVRYGAHPR